MSEELLCRLENRVALLTLNRPERLNALTKDMMATLRARLADAAIDDAVGCVVLTGAGNAFCAGGDVRVQAQVAAEGTPESPERRTDMLRASMEASRLLHEMPKPTIAMVNGVAAGAGLSLALACDLRIVGRSARDDDGLCQSGTVRRLRRHMVSDATDWHGQGARAVFPVGRAGCRADRSTWPGQPCRGRRRTGGGDDGTGGEAGERAKRRAALYEAEPERGGIRHTGGGLDSEAYGMLRARASEDHKEAARAFVEKRKPVFGGR